MKKFKLAATLFMVGCVAVAKSSSDVMGQIVDGNGEPMGYVNVVLLSLPDSSFVQGSTSDETGKFNIVTPEGEGLLKISSVGYKTVYMNMRDFGGSIQLFEDDRMIEEITVKAQLPKTKLTGNSMVTDIEGSVLGHSGTAKDMLAKVPGMTLSGDDLKVLGRGKPVFYINGRKLQDLDELKRLRSEEIKNVEVITNPGAQYDATVTAVVRITTLKRKGNGFGYDITATDNIDLAYDNNDPGSTFNMRYRHNNVDVFGTLNFWTWSSNADASPTQQSRLMTENGLLIIDQKTKIRQSWRGNGINSKLGFNWQIADNHSIGMRIERHDKLSDRGPMEQENFLSQYIVGSDNIEHLHDKSTQLETAKNRYNWDGNAYYNGRVGKLGIDLNLDFVTKKATEKNEIREEGRSPMFAESPSASHMEAGKLVLSYPIWRGQLEAGSEMTFVGRAAAYNLICEDGGIPSLQGGSVIPETNSKVHETNVAAFAQYAFSLEKWGNFSAGLRYEHVGFDFTDYIEPANSMTRYTDDIFPSASWSQQFGNWQAALSYSFKTIRPSYWELNGAFQMINPYAAQMGDPTLKNEKRHEVSASTRWKWVTFFLNYERRDDALTQWSYIYNDKGVILIKNVNYQTPYRTLAAYVSMSPTWGCFTPNWLVGVQKSFLEKTLADPSTPTGSRVIRTDRPVGFFQLNNTFRFKHSWQFECNANITTTGDVDNYYLLDPEYNVGFVAQKCWLKNDALCLRASVSDVFKSGPQSIRLDCGYYTLNQHQNHCRHRLDISLRYSFNATPSKYKGTGAGRDAVNRMDK